jgi:glutathione synthase/RimK-type ligase-like ATP-grasp enzyme
VLNSDCISPPLVLQRAGVPVPRTIFCATADRAVLRGYVERLGGFPVVVKFLGRSRGIGVLRADSHAALFSLLDFALDQGASPLLCSYIAGAVHWRVVVIGGRAVAAYRNQNEEDDFRTYASDDVHDYTAQVAPRLGRIAVRATQALGLEMGGVDVLEDPAGRRYVLEVNFPCFFAQAQLVAGVDVAGMMVDYLLAKAERPAVNRGS